MSDAYAKMIAPQEAAWVEAGEHLALLESLRTRTEVPRPCGCGHVAEFENPTLIHPAVVRYLLAFIDSLERAEEALAGLYTDDDDSAEFTAFVIGRTERDDDGEWMVYGEDVSGQRYYAKYLVRVEGRPMKDGSSSLRSDRPPFRSTDIGRGGQYG